MQTNGQDATKAVERVKAALRHNILTLPVPGAPPLHSRGGGDLGLAFLNTAFRLNHVTRVTEQIEIVETASARRRVSLDLSLRLLDSTQEFAGRRLNELRGDDRPPASDGSAAARGPLLWVPIARLSRRAVAPVEVMDAEGRLVPRLTQGETLRLMQAGVYRTLRNILRAKPEASDVTHDLYRYLHHLDEARWLTETAVAHTILAGGDRAERTVAGNGSLGANVPRPRLDALRALEHMVDDGDDVFYRLLTECVSDYLVIVGLDASKDEHHLSYDGPLLLAGDPERTRWSRLSPRRAGLVVEYRTPISAGPASYHLSIDVAPDVHICRFLLQTTNDAAEARALVERLRELADHVERNALDEAVRQSKVVEYELQDIIARLTLLTKARTDDWTMFAARSDMDPTDALVSLGQLCERYAAGELTKLADSPWARPAELRRLADLIDENQLGTDIVVENDPRESGAHVYWRNRRVGSRRTDERSLATARMHLVDDTPSLIHSVVLTTAALAVVVYAVASFALRTALWPVTGARGDTPHLTQADAIVTVLLLAPGFLFTRLDLPSSRTVLGSLRALPRLLAVVAVASTTYAAIVVATGPPSRSSARWHFLGSLALLAVAVGVGLVHRRAIGSAIGDRSLAGLAPPRWADGRRSADAEREADIVFHAVGAMEITSFASDSAAAVRR